MTTTLSPREIEVVQLTCKGYLTKHIAAELSISARTVETHRDRVYKKLNIQGIAQLVVWAITNEVHKVKPPQLCPTCGQPIAPKPDEKR